MKREVDVEQEERNGGSDREDDQQGVSFEAFDTKINFLTEKQCGKRITFFLKTLIESFHNNPEKLLLLNSQHVELSLAGFTVFLLQGYNNKTF